MATVKAILLEPVKNKGHAGDIVILPRGFFRYLKDMNKAKYATKEAIARLESEREMLRISDEARKTSAETLRAKLTGYVLHIVREAGENGVLYGAVSARDITRALEVDGFMLDHHQVLLPHGMKEVGEYVITLELHPSVSLTLPLKVTARHSTL
jgi:large subunit ribosomal protein L9